MAGYDGRGYMNLQHIFFLGSALYGGAFVIFFGCYWGQIVYSSGVLARVDL